VKKYKKVAIILNKREEDLNKIDAAIVVTPITTLLLALYNPTGFPWIILRLLLAFPTLLFIPGYSIVKNFFNKDRFGFEEWAYSMAISISIIVLSGYLIDVMGILLPYQFFTKVACAVTLVAYGYRLLLYFTRGKAS